MSKQTEKAMKCPKCGKTLIKRRNYSPSKGFQDGFIYSHVYSLSEVLDRSGKVCKYSVVIK